MAAIQVKKEQFTGRSDEQIEPPPVDDYKSEDDENDTEPEWQEPQEIPVEEEFTPEELEGIDPSWPDRIRRIGARKKREELEQ